MHRLSRETLAAIGAEIRDRRQAAGFTLEQLATLSALSCSCINRIELGQAEVSISALWSIAGALRCAVSDLLPGEDDGLPPEVRAAARALNLLDPEIRDALYTLLRNHPSRGQR